MSRINKVGIPKGGSLGQVLVKSSNADFDTEWGAGTGVGSGLTSVGLSMPTAFSVSNSPLTSDGTIYVSGAGTTADYIRGDGTLATLPILSSSAGYCGAFSDYTNQTASAINTAYAMTLNTTDYTNAVSVVSGSRITFANTGVYNVQWSGQFKNTDTSSEHDVTIWIRKNGVDVVGSSGFVAVPRKTGGIDGHALPSWNYLLDIAGGDYVEFIWATTSTNVSITTYTASSPYPSTASVIVTATMQAGILAGTGMTALNGLTADVQYFAVGSSGTDFNISSATSTHTFNIPTASATNRGLLSSGDFTTFNSKQSALSGTGIVKSTSGTISYISGTSSQFIKGDGSLDSSSYLTGASTISFSTDVTTIGSQTLGNSISVKVIGLNGTALPTLSTTAGLLKWTGATGTWVLDSNTYLTTSSASSTYVPYTGATNNVILGNYYLQSEVGLRIKPSYTSDWVSALSSAGNGISARGTLILREFSTGNGFFASIYTDDLTASRDILIPDKDGTIALTSDLTSYMTNPMTTLGDIIYGGASGTATRLAGSTSASKVFLSQTGTGSASSAPAWSSVTKTDVGLSNVENTALSTWAGSSNITTLGTITTGTWSATTIGITKGGTGLSALGTANQLLRVNAGATALEYFTPSYITTAITTLNTLTASTQTFAVGTSGTDFAISSATSTHTFNLPTASATNRGALSSSDWSLFNGKQSAITLTTTGSSGSATFVSNTLNIPTYTLAGLGGLSNPMTTLGDMIYGGTSGVATRLVGQTTTAKQYLSQTGTGTASAIPVWATIAFADISGTVGITQGGTGQTSKTNAFDALAPTSAVGDLIYHNGTDNVALSGNITTTKQFLSQTGNGTISASPSWSVVTKTDVGLSNVENTALSTWAGSTNITTLGTIGTGTWNATAIGVTKGGTGLTALGTANQLIRVNASATALEYFTPSYLTSAITSLGGLSSSVQTFATSTTGTDFTISSATSTHTFNLPIASATNTGKLSSTDWSTFNNKLSTAILSLNSLTATSQTFANDTNVTITSATSTHTIGWSGQLSVGRGGTGASTLTGILVGNGTSAVTAITGTASQLLRRNAGNTAYEFFTFSGLTNPMTTLGDIIYEDATPAPARLAGNITTTKQFLSQTGTGTISAVPAWSVVSKSDVGLANVENTALSTWAGSTNITTLGTIGTGTWSGTAISAIKGGTGQTSFAVGDLLYADTTTTLAKLADVATGNALISGGVSTAPSWGKIGLTTHVSGTLPIANGGTNSTATPTNGGVSYGTGTAFAFTSAGTSGQALVSAGASAPSWTTLTLENLPDAWVKKSVACATTTALTLNTAQTTIDGVTISATSRVLVKNQATASQNGIYTNMTTTSWVRATDADTASEIAGAMVNIDDGTTNGGLTYDTDFKVTDTLGTTAMNWNRLIDTGYTIPTTQGGTGLTAIGSALQVLRVNSGGTALEYATISGSGITSLNGLSGATQTFTNDTNITITSAGTAHALGWSGSLAVGRGGTGTTTAFTTGSVIFAGASGVYSQNNTNFFWDTTNNRLGLGHATPTTRFHIAGSTTASAGLAKTFLNTSTLVASANNDILIAQEITPTFTLGAFTGTQSIALRIGAGALELQNQNIILNATTGTKIGTATTQKLAFWNKTPVAQPTTAIAASGRVAGGGTNITTTDTFAGYTIQQIVNALITTGILA